MIDYSHILAYLEMNLKAVIKDTDSEPILQINNYGGNVQRDDEYVRWLLLGAFGNGKILLVAHTARIGDIIRIISARRATKNEQKYTLRGSQNKKRV